MEYENIIHLLSGGQIRFIGQRNLIQENLEVEDWTFGSIVLNNEADTQYLIPRRDIRFIETAERKRGNRSEERY